MVVILFVPKETHEEETRVMLIPSHAEKLVSLGVEVLIEKDLGKSILVPDAEYEKVGCKVVASSADGMNKANLIARIRKPTADQASALKAGQIHVSYLDPFNEIDLVKKMTSTKATVVSLEMIPRTTKAQKMDVLSSQASLAGYVAVLMASNELNQILPMMMTPAGTISPSRVFIIGAGVAGLQAIATAKRLGARVEAFDTRPVVEEQVQSLGAKFVKADLGEMGQTSGGYAKALTEDQLKKQQEVMAKYCKLADIVITTAQLFGRKAPTIVTADMVKSMRPGSIVVDLAVETGGNVVGSKVGENVNIGGVTIMGQCNLPGRVPVHASQMLSANLFNFIDEFWNKEGKSFALPPEDEIAKGCIVSRDGQVVNDMLKDKYN